MPDIFISYSRKDKTFVANLFAALEKCQLDAWVDWHGIPPSADWLQEIYTAIDGVNTFVFVISPDSMVSEICHKEVTHAQRQHKRIVPIMHRDVDKKDFAHAWFEQDWEQEARQNWETLNKLNWVNLRDTDDFQAGVDKLVEAIQTDLDHVRNHTRWLIKAQEWDKQGRKASFVIRGDELHEAEKWLVERGSKDPAPTSLHIEFIEASREQTQHEENTRLKRERDLLQARFGVALAILLIALLAVVFFAMQSRTERNNASTLEAQIATSNYNAANAKTQAYIALAAL